MAWKKRQKIVVFAESCGLVQRSKTDFLCSFGAEKVNITVTFSVILR